MDRPDSGSKISIVGIFMWNRVDKGRDRVKVLGEDPEGLQ